MTDALLPLRCAYGVEVPGAPAEPPPPGAPGHAEWSLLCQTRDVLDRWPRPSPEPAAVAAAHLDALRASLAPPPATAFAPYVAVRAAVLAYAADASLAAVRLAYDEPLALGVVPSPAEVAVVTQSRDLLAAAPSAGAPHADVLASVRARAGAATAVAAEAPAEAPVDVPALAALAAVYGLPHAHAADPVEAAVLAGARDALSLGPRPRPADAALEAVLARAAVAPQTAGDRPAVVSRDRAAAPPARSARRSPSRTGLWAGASALAGALFMVVMLSRPDALPTSTDASVAAGLVAEAAPPVAEADVTTGSPDTETTSAPAPLTPAVGAADRGAPAEPVASAPTASAAPRRADDVRPAPARLPVVVPPPPPPSSAPPLMQAAVARSVAPDARPADAALVPAASRAPEPSAWDAARDLRTLSLRVSTLRRTASGSDWVAPAEAFGAPRTPVTMSFTPAVQAVRSGAPARARVLPDTSRTGD